MGEVQTQSKGVIIPFPGLASRSRPPADEKVGPFGQLLLFTGVRYERTTDPSPTLSDGRDPSRRQRRS